MRFFVTAVTVFAATSFALPLGSIVPPGTKEYILSVVSEDGSVKGSISQKNGKLGVFPNAAPAQFFTTTYEPSKTLAFHIGDLSNQIILVGSNGLLDIDDLVNPSTDTIPKGKLAEWSTFTIAANGTLGVKDGSDIPSRRWIAYPSSDGYIISLYDGYTKNNAKMTTVQVTARDAPIAPSAPVPPPAPQGPALGSSPRPGQPRPQPNQLGSADPLGTPYPRVQPGPGALQPYAPTFVGGQTPPGDYVPYNPNAAPSWQAPPASPQTAPLPVQDPNAPVLYPSADGPASSSGPSLSAGGAIPQTPNPVQAPTTTISQPWWDPFGLFSGNKSPSNAAVSPSPSPEAPKYTPAAGVNGAAPNPSPTPDLFTGLATGFNNAINGFLGLGQDTNEETDPADVGDDFSL